MAVRTNAFYTATSIRIPGQLFVTSCLCFMPVQMASPPVGLSLRT
jgi:hypothetical protein